MGRLAIVIAVAFVLSVSGALGLVRGSDPESPPGPAPDTGAVAAAGRADAGDISAMVGSLQDRLRTVPSDDRTWAALGLAYVEQARVSGNPTFYDQAEQAVDRSLRLNPQDNAVALAARAALDAARHDFTDALDAADQALRIDPYQPNALFVRVDALTELGRYREQLTALSTADTRQPGVPVAARYSYAYELRGDLAEASRILRRSAASSSGADRAYLLTLLGDLDRRRGRLDDSATHLREALRLAPESVAARAATARLSVARGRYGEAVTRWSEVVALLPLPEYLTELGELEEFLGDDDAAQAQYDVVDATTRLFASKGVNTDLEVALFAADHADAETAVASARTEWGRRHSIHVADVYAWSLHQAGRDGAALRLSRAATRLGTAEARMWIHRGTIEASLGLDAQARTHLRRGLGIDPGFAPLQVREARALLSSLEAGA